MYPLWPVRPGPHCLDDVRLFLCHHRLRPFGRFDNGLHEFTLGRPSGILWLVPVLLAVLLSVFLVSYFGQRLGHDQMERLHNFLEDCLGREIDAAEHVG